MIRRFTLQEDDKTILFDGEQQVAGCTHTLLHVMPPNNRRLTALVVTHTTSYRIYLNRATGSITSPAAYSVYEGTFADQRHFSILSLVEWPMHVMQVDSRYGWEHPSPERLQELIAKCLRD